METLERSGQLRTTSLELLPGLPRSHVELNEVLANPAGAEATQEWVELYNDGAVPVSLALYTLEDSGGRTVLPEGVLEAGGYALVVVKGYVPDAAVDPVPPSGTLLLEVAELGRAGLSNEGERLTLRDAAGVVVSTFPAIKTKNGVSIARAAPDAFDDDPSSFAPSERLRASPGEPNLP